MMFNYLVKTRPQPKTEVSKPLMMDQKWNSHTASVYGTSTAPRSAYTPSTTPRTGQAYVPYP